LCDSRQTARLPHPKYTSVFAGLFLPDELTLSEQGNASRPWVRFTQDSSLQLHMWNARPGSAISPLTKAEDKTSGNARIVLRVVGELGAKVIHLNQAQPDVPRGLDVEAAAEGHAKGLL
jgi:hypothetical protein